MADKERGTLVSTNKIVSLDEVESINFTPAEAFGHYTGEVVSDLVTRVGYRNKIVITIEELPSDHSLAPGFQIRAKTRLEN